MSQTTPTSTSRRNGLFLLAFLLVALVLAGVVSSYASGSPDGLEKVAADKGFDVGARDHSFAGSPLADYSTAGVDNATLSTGLSGVAGVLLCVVIGGGLFLVLRRRTPLRGGGEENRRRTE